jgi:hypothetical protein
MPADADRSLSKRLAAVGVATTLLSDDPQITGHPLAKDFDTIVPIEAGIACGEAALPPDAEPADEVEETHLARCFGEIIQQLESARDNSLLWCHLASLGTIWDAPLVFRNGYMEEGDPPPSYSVLPPNRILPPNGDPDELLGIVQSYAGQVTLFDTCLGALLDFLDESPAGRETLVIVASTRGFPLGEHRRAGECDGALYSELVHTPWIMRFPNGLGAGIRSQTLTEPADLWATLLDWWRLPVPASPTARSLLPLVRQQPFAPRDRLCIRGAATEIAIRTPAWYLRFVEEPELYAKPDDRWEVNNVAQRCPEIVEGLREAASQFTAARSAGSVANLPPLSDVLSFGLE